jgi:ATP/maltotriose-dependent transcriptional regulator MalT
MAPRPLRVRIEGEDAEALRALARSGGLILAQGDEEADLVARPSKPGMDNRGASSGSRLGATRSLSRRELEILDYLVDGWSNAEIASVLCVKVRTVRFHLEGIYAKLGVARRGEAVREALRLGLIRYDA